MNVPAYLDRIGYKGPAELTSETLRILHRRHLETVPFENLDISRSRPIALDENRIVHKVVEEHRGGFCYELNSAFAALLRALGFQVTLLSGLVARADGSDGPEFIISPCVLTWSKLGLLMSVLATPFGAITAAARHRAEGGRSFSHR